VRDHSIGQAVGVLLELAQSSFEIVAVAVIVVRWRSQRCQPFAIRPGCWA